MDELELAAGLARIRTMMRMFDVPPATCPSPRCPRWRTSNASARAASPSWP
ncbi:hypothetical protein [Nonomuraea salmonea]|uniref:hypothetical protein n=1 Tax=Nonomuraea salmonea TaxID=46181 RepID=UPI0031F04A72